MRLKNYTSFAIAPLQTLVMRQKGGTLKKTSTIVLTGIVCVVMVVLTVIGLAALFVAGQQPKRPARRKHLSIADPLGIPTRANEHPMPRILEIVPVRMPSSSAMPLLRTV